MQTVFSNTELVGCHTYQLIKIQPYFKLHVQCIKGQEKVQVQPWKEHYFTLMYLKIINSVIYNLHSI